LVRKGFGDEKNRIWGSRKVEELTNVINIWLLRLQSSAIWRRVVW
jgi:hypothetical protein